MPIPPKQSGKTSKYHFDDLLKKKNKFPNSPDKWVLKFKAAGKQIDHIRAAASAWAKKNGVRVTTRLCSGGVAVYFV